MANKDEDYLKCPACSKVPSPLLFKYIITPAAFPGKWIKVRIACTHCRKIWSGFLAEESQGSSHE